MLRNGTMKAPEGRKKKRRKRRSSSSSKVTFETAKDRLESQFVAEDRGTPNLPPRTQKTAQRNGIGGTPSSVLRSPKFAEIEAKKRRLLAVVSAAAGDIDSPILTRKPTSALGVNPTMSTEKTRTKQTKIHKLMFSPNQQRSQTNRVRLQNGQLLMRQTAVGHLRRLTELKNHLPAKR